MRELRLETARGVVAGLRHGPTGGVPVLAVHGWLDNAASFLPMMPLLEGLDVVAVDLPGHGHSAHREGPGDYLLPDWVLDLLAVLDALGWNRAALLGHSLGGAACLMTAVAAPERVARLALVEAAGPLSGRAADAPARLREAVQARRRPAREGLRTFPDLATAVRARMQANALSQAAARLLVERGIAPVEGGFAWRSDRRLTLPTAIRVEEPTVEAWLRAVTCPVHVVAAATSPPYFPAHQRESRLACLVDATCTVLPGGHHLHMETPEPVAAAIAPFLREASGQD